MTLLMENTAIARVALLSQVRDAASAAVRLMSLWPLDVKLLANDAKYTENLQVRISRALAALKTGQTVTIPDAEFVYEGAEDIPGRPQEIVDALVAANDSCDVMSEYSQTGDTALVMRACAVLDVSWSQKTVQDVADALEQIESAVARARGVKDGADGEVTDEAVVGAATQADAHGIDTEAVAQRFAMLALACDGLIDVIDGDVDDADQGDDHESVLRRVRRILPIMVYSNELCERLMLPRICWKEQEFVDMLVAHEMAHKIDTATVLATGLAPLAGVEWTKHRDDLLWDPDEAKKKAKEDDDRRNKEALAAKFAHVPDPHVEGIAE